ncbi:TlpA disulfide reductase family protein [Sulfitobacter sabulilitoris]|uniref:TlpA family protein disulfide reductase n=1 Tax=Sulfitobacter sabulilitoris TaxID=2562655 RepID=A0A5S3PI11_9RHOB|nr:TlpA disulfide reductase family protein [Sulfitobacter sabulilitoris]TMM51575.1 TlpA family protein disulfide reductase [Sulfitobacter sabulilitoris]
MKVLFAAFVYTALTLGAIWGAGGAWADTAAIEGLRDGDMKKLVVHATPEATSSAPFQLADDAGETSLDAYRGKYILLNFWATWCAPCRKEMPQLSALQADFGGDDFEVLTIATGRNSPQGIAKFFDEIGVTNLPRHQDPQQQLASQMGIFGLPISVILDPEGREIARLRGDADWNSESARAIVAALIASTGT